METYAPASEMITEIAWKFLDSRKGQEFKREELVKYISTHGTFTDGAVTGTLNRLLRDNAVENSIEVKGRGFYKYCPTAKPTLKKTINAIFDKAFAEATKTINSRPVSDFSAEEMTELVNIKQVLEMQSTINKLLQ